MEVVDIGSRTVRLVRLLQDTDLPQWDQAQPLEGRQLRATFIPPNRLWNGRTPSTYRTLGPRALPASLSIFRMLRVGGRVLLFGVFQGHGIRPIQKPTSCFVLPPPATGLGNRRNEVHFLRRNPSAQDRQGDTPTHQEDQSANRP